MDRTGTAKDAAILAATGETEMDGRKIVELIAELTHSLSDPLTAAGAYGQVLRQHLDGMTLDIASATQIHDRLIERLSSVFSTIRQLQMLTADLSRRTANAQSSAVVLSLV